MTSTSETGHIKNIANFEDLIAFCVSYGTNYNPSRTAIQIPALTTLYNQARNSITVLNTAKTSFIQATNARQAIFEPIKKLATRMINALDSTEASAQIVKDAKTINLKIQGKRSAHNPPTPIPANGEIAQEKTISVSQQSYDNLIENFAKLLTILVAETSYNPNEVELQTNTLQTYLDQLRTANTAVTTAYTNYSTARIDRNTILYNPSTGLLAIAADVKKYVKSIFGATHPRYKQISSLEFKTIKQ